MFCVSPSCFDSTVRVFSSGDLFLGCVSSKLYRAVVAAASPAQYLV